MQKRTYCTRPFFLAAALTLAAAGAVQAQHGHGDHGHADGSGHGVPLYETLGDHGLTIATTSPTAQQYFNQGLRLQYAFNHAEAIRSYEHALDQDASCAMCWWGIALASGPNINAGMDEESGRRAYAAINEARRLKKGDGFESALVEALAKRYSDDPAAERGPLDKAYADAMARVAKDYPESSDAQTLYAAALMNLNPWNYWSGDYGDRKPNEGTPQILASLERAMASNKNNPGACHYYIHAVEAAHPERAIDCAERLAGLMPGAGHIVHMPGHIYIRVGRYRDAVAANDHAVHSDETFIADQSPMGLYPMAYYPHNYHFMAFAATMAGMSGKAMEASDLLAPRVSKEVALQVYFLQNAVVFPHLTAVTFGQWDRVLGFDMPDPELGAATGMAHYARGIAFAATGRAAEARKELAALYAVATEFDATDENPIFQIAKLSLEAEIDLRTGDAAKAVDAFTRAVEIEDAMLYEEPPLWYYPVRHSLGRALLEAGRPADAEVAYRYDLLKYPENGWSLFGLAKSLEAQGKNDGARSVMRRFEAAWQHADVKLPASRF